MASFNLNADLAATASLHRHLRIRTPSALG
jgi:hypothetical protein